MNALWESARELQPQLPHGVLALVAAPAKDVI